MNVNTMINLYAACNVNSWNEKNWQNYFLGNKIKFCPGKSSVDLIAVKDYKIVYILCMQLHIIWIILELA